MLLMRETQPHKQGKTKNSGELKLGDPTVARTLFVRARTCGGNESACGGNQNVLWRIPPLAELKG